MAPLVPLENLSDPEMVSVTELPGARRVGVLAAMVSVLPDAVVIIPATDVLTLSLPGVPDGKEIVPPEAGRVMLPPTALRL